MIPKIDVCAYHNRGYCCQIKSSFCWYQLQVHICCIKTCDKAISSVTALPCVFTFLPAKNYVNLEEPLSHIFSNMYIAGQNTQQLGF